MTSTSGSRDRTRPRLVHLTTTDMSLDWLLGPQLRAFADRGYEVIGMSAPGPHVAGLEAMGIQYVAVPALTRSNDPLNDVRALIQITRQLRKLRPDVLHTHNPKPGILGRVAGRLARVPRIVNTQHGLYAQPGDRWQRRLPVYALERFAAAFSHAELVQNPEDVDTLVCRLHVPAHRVHLLGNGIDLGRFSTSAVDPAARLRLRAEWGISDGAVVVGTVGRLVREKGLVEILDAAHALRLGGIDVRFVVIGPPDPTKTDSIPPEMQQQAIDDGVVFAGERANMPECYSALDIFLTASWREGFPRSAMEAAAMGLPSIGTDIRGTRQVIEQDVTGILVPVRDPHALCEAVKEMLARRPGWGAMSEAARARAVREFDHTLQIERSLAAYRG